jgi:NADH-quinone oxidoreductase subunit G
VKAETLKITVDGKVMEAKPGEMVIAAAERGGVYIPRFCWHPRMRPVGMCRMCLVEVKGPRGFSLMPSCYVPVADGQEVVTDSPKVKKAQDGVLEFLLINHPLDCPVCDRGGECPLQDQTFAFGPGESRFVEEKRHWAKPIPINPLVALDRERCIQCARCTRFADEVAGDAMIDFVGRADMTEVNTFPDRPFTSNFSGNIVQICPVGALTATPYRFRARPWDLDVVESTCTACAVGCRMALQSSSNRLIRHLGVDSEPVNHGWLCDKGRFGYEMTDSPARLRQPLVRRGDALVETSWNEALDVAAQGLRRVRDASGPGALAVLGGARLANEDAYAWAKLAKSVLGTDNVDCQMGDGLPAELVLGLPRATIDEACGAGAVVLLAPDLKEELPVLYLRLREAAVDGGLKLIEISPQGTGLSGHAEVRLQYRPGEVAAVARALAAERVPDEGAGGVAAADIGAAAELLGEAGSVVVVLGRPSLAESADIVADAAGVLATALPDATFLPALRRGNVHGALDMGLAPGVLPGRTSLDDGREWFARSWARIPARRGMDAAEILRAAGENRIQGLVLVGADPAADFPDRALARRGLAGVGFTVVVDLFGGAASPNGAPAAGPFADADVVLPAAGYGERPGTTANLEGRVSRLGQKVTAPGTARPDWMIAADLAARLGADLGFSSLDDVAAEIEQLAPAYAGLTPQVLARPGFRDGLVVPVAAPAEVETDRPKEGIEVAATQAHLGPVVHESAPEADAPLQPLADGTHGPSGDRGPSGGPSGDASRPPLLRFRPGPPTRPAPPVDAYSLRLVAGRTLYDAGALVSRSPSLAALAQGPRLRANPADLGRLGVKTGDRIRVTSARTSLVLDVVADPHVLRGSAVLVFNAPGEGAAELIDASQPVTDVRIETVKPGPSGRERANPGPSGRERANPGPSGRERANPGPSGRERGA